MTPSNKPINNSKNFLEALFDGVHASWKVSPVVLRAAQEILFASFVRITISSMRLKNKKRPKTKEKTLS